jgi:hypothetical protein
MPDKKLILFGDGPEMEKRPKIQTSSASASSRPRSCATTSARAKAFIVPAEEDFGIVPVEAQLRHARHRLRTRRRAETVISPEPAAARGVTQPGTLQNSVPASGLRRFEAMSAP